jgi:RNA methyltransferase, TrmH family
MIAAVSSEQALIPRYGRARRDEGLAVLEGFHPLKHALRFGATVLEVLCEDRQALSVLCDQLAPDLEREIMALAREAPRGALAKIAPMRPPTGVISLAERPRVDALATLADAREAPVVLLDDPRDLGNMGACVRVAAAANAGGVLVSAGHDPWHPDVLRGAAGLHFALPVARLAAGLPAQLERPLVALDPEGEPLGAGAHSPLPSRALLAFGSERRGLSEELLARADRRVAIPMRAGVSSLNLATSVAVVLFAGRLAPSG